MLFQTYSQTAIAFHAMIKINSEAISNTTQVARGAVIYRPDTENRHSVEENCLFSYKFHREMKNSISLFARESGKGVVKVVWFTY